MADVPGWTTTDSASRAGVACGGPTGSNVVRPIEIWVNGGLNMLAAEGVQFAELNAYVNSRLYQNVCLLKGDTITYEFQHRRRPFLRGTDDPSTFDVMRFGLNPLGSTAVQVDRSLTGVAGSPATTARTSGNSWVTYSGTANFVGTSGLWEVGFEPVSSASGTAWNPASPNLSVGNLLDNVQFSLSPVVQLAPNQAATVYEGQSATVNLRVSGPLSTPLTVHLQVTGGTATTGDDYSLPNGGTASDFTVVVPAGNYDGSTNIPFTIPALVDALVESSETLSVQVLSNAAYNIGSTVTCGALPAEDAQITILDRVDLAATITAPPTVVEGSTVSGSASCTNVGVVPAPDASCSITGLPQGATLSCTPAPLVNPLAVGASMRCSFSFTAPAAGTNTALTVTTSSSAPESDTSNNSAAGTVRSLTAAQIAAMLNAVPLSPVLSALIGAALALLGGLALLRRRAS